jgi:Protein of unknown function (DUF3455)
MNFRSKVLLNVAVRATIISISPVSAEMPPATAWNDGAEIATLHAEGAQLYECKVDASNGPASEPRAPRWKFREPIATLMTDGESIGRHYTGPNWDHIDGSGVKGKVVASTPGATPNDIPWLKLNVVEHRGIGILSGVTTIQRINTKGGVAPESCENPGGYLSVPYSADYVFLRGAT